MNGWTTVADVQRKLRRRWDSGTFLAWLGEHRPWQPLGLSLRGPGPRDVGADLAAVQSWASAWERAARRFDRLEHRTVGGRLVGANLLPAKVWIDSYERLWSVLGVEREAARFAALVNDTRVRAPRVVDWMVGHPLRVLDLEAVWAVLVDVVLWIDAHAHRRPYLRQIDVAGADTKFIERHRAVLAELLDRQLDDGRVDDARPRSDFARRYGLRDRPVYVRLRALDGPRLAGGFSELSVRVDELAARAPECSTVYVVENETTFLAFPPVDDAIAVWGGGYAAAVLESLTWLRERELIYWGDIDTHGFAILDRLRQAFPHARSMLMDRATLIAHEAHWEREGRQHVAHLARLWPSEADLYRDLVEDALGRSVRLEQERISYACIERALAGDDLAAVPAGSADRV